MVCFPNCKVNLGLYVTSKRSDGFHDIETVFLPLPALSDILEIVKANEYHPGKGPRIAGRKVEYSQSGIDIVGDAEDNLCVRAYKLLAARFPGLPSVKMHLRKIVPIGAGLGGGSADGAFALSTLNALFRLGMSQAELSEVALQLGSDCPFFLTNRPAFATGRGEVLSPIDLPQLLGCHLVLVNPGIHVPTGWAFRQLSPAPPSTALLTALALPLEAWQGLVGNDFEAAVAAAHPAVPEAKEALLKMGAEYASMSGSGSTVFGIFRQRPELPPSLFPAHYLTRSLPL